MPLVVPNIPYMPPVTQSGAVFIGRAPSASPATLHLDAAIATSEPFGSVVSLCSLGFDMGTAPDYARSVAVSAPGTTFERALAMVFAPFIAVAQATAGLRVFIEEFSADGSFMGGFAGPMTTIFDLFEFFGSDIYANSKYIGAFFRLPAVPGRRYRVWVDLVQSAVTEGWTTAVSNCTVTVGQNYPPGTPQAALYNGTIWVAFDDWI